MKKNIKVKSSFKGSFLDKKKKGDFETGVMAFFILIAFAIVWQVFLYNMRGVSTARNVNEVINNYEIRCESDGYLSESNVLEMEQDLAEAGMVNIDVRTGTNLVTNPAEYGQPVTLHVQGAIKTYKFTLNGWFSFERTEELTPIDETRKTTSHGMTW